MWKFEQSLAAGQTGITHVAFDGRDVWAANAAQIKVWAYIDEEYLAHEYQFDNGLFALREVATINHGTIVDAMVFWDGKMYMKSGVEIKAYDVTTYAQVGATIPLPEVTVGSYVLMQAAMCAANNKLWFVSQDSETSPNPLGGIPTSDCQQLYYYDLITQTWGSPVLIPGRKQYTTRSIVDGLDGHVYITALNEHSIVKFTTSGAYVGSYRINRHPYFLQSNQYQQVYVVSDAQTDPLKGMVSVFDTSTNTSTNYAAAVGAIQYMADNVVVSGDPENPTALRAAALAAGQLVYVGGTPRIGLLNKTNKKIKYYQNSASDDYVPGAALEISVTPLHGFVTPQLSFDVWDGSALVAKTVKPYVFFSTTDALYACRLSSLVCVNSMEVLGTAMIATGAQNYYGDIV